jgi:hypothetical protein
MFNVHFNPKYRKQLEKAAFFVAVVKITGIREVPIKGCLFQ